MLSKALSFLRQILRWGLTQSLEYLDLSRGSRQEFPRALTLQRTLCEALLSRDPQQVATRLPEATFERVVGPRQARHVIAVEQARPRAPADRVEVQSKLISSRGARGPSPHRIERAAQLLCDLLTPERRRDSRC